MGKLIVLGVLVANLSGCSALAEVIYDVSQDSAMNRCDAMASAGERADCRRRNGKTYDDYRSERDKARDAK
jgi:hypothetical protein